MGYFLPSLLILAKIKQNKVQTGTWVSSAYSNSMGRIPEGCVDADRAVTTAEDTEVMLFEFWLLYKW